MEPFNSNFKIQCEHLKEIEEDKSQETSHINENSTNLNQEANFVLYLNDLNINMSKCHYRKVIEDIEKKQEIIGYNLRLSWKLYELKIRSMLKILNRKTFTCDNYSEIIPLKKNSQHIERWLRKIDNELTKWKNTLETCNCTFHSTCECLQKDSIENEEQIEQMCQLYLEELYILSIHCKRKNQIPDCIAYLTFAESIIKSHAENIKDPRTFSIMQKLLLFISAIHIADKDFETAKGCQMLCIKLCFQEIFLRVDMENGVNLDTLPKATQYYMTRILTNIVLCFYQRGVCYENLGYMVKAIESYKQSRWFSVKYLKSEVIELARYMIGVEKRAFSYLGAMLSTKESNDANILKEKEIRTKEEKKEHLLKRIATGNYYDTPNVEQVVQYIDKLKIPEVESSYIGNKDSKYISYYLSTVHLMEDLQSEQFRDIIKKMNKLEFNKIEKETQEIIERKAREIKKGKKLVSPHSQNASRNYQRSLRLDTGYNFTDVTNTTKKDEQNYLRTEPHAYGSTLTQFQRVMSKTPGSLLKYQPNTVRKINYSQYVLAKSFKKKQMFLEKMNTRELSFQKQILSLKGKEKITWDNPLHDIKKAQMEAKMSFERMVNFSRTYVKKKKNPHDSKKKIKEQIDKLERCSVLSLDPKHIQEIKEIARRTASSGLKKRQSLRDDITGRVWEEKNRIFFTDVHQVKKNNQQMIQNIEKDIEILDNHEKRIHTALKSLRGCTFKQGMKSNMKKSRMVKDMSYFLRTEGSFSK